MHFRKSRLTTLICALLTAASISLNSSVEAAYIEMPTSIDVTATIMTSPAITGPFSTPNNLGYLSQNTTTPKPIANKEPETTTDDTSVVATTETPSDDIPVITATETSAPTAEAPAPVEPVELTKILPDIPIEADLQHQLLDGPCEGNLSRFCLIIAMGSRESDYDFAKIGDSGRSFGWLQIMRRYHEARIKNLGITDLMDPLQNATVALDYLSELAASQNLTLDDIPTHYLMMSYNAGPSGAAKMARRGITSTDYSREVLGNYNLFMTELGLF